MENRVETMDLNGGDRVRLDDGRVVRVAFIDIDPNFITWIILEDGSRVEAGPVSILVS